MCSKLCCYRGFVSCCREPMFCLKSRREAYDASGDRLASENGGADKVSGVVEYKLAFLRPFHSPVFSHAPPPPAPH